MPHRDPMPIFLNLPMNGAPMRSRLGKFPPCRLRRRRWRSWHTQRRRDNPEYEGRRTGLMNTAIILSLKFPHDNWYDYVVKVAKGLFKIVDPKTVKPNVAGSRVAIATVPLGCSLTRPDTAMVTAPRRRN